MSNINNSELVIAGQESFRKDTWIVRGRTGQGNNEIKLTGEQFRKLESELAEAGGSLIKTMYSLHAGTPAFVTMMYRGGRLDCNSGPAVSIEALSGGSLTEQWYINGQRMSEEEFNNYASCQKLISNYLN